jgi:hypothetical protein
VLSLVNRPGNRPSHEGAAAEVDRCLKVCFAGGFRRVLLRGDTDFSQTEHLDRWNADGRIQFIFGYDNCPNLVDMAEKLPPQAWQKLQRPPRYTVATSERARPDNVKDAVVKRRQFETLRLQSEEVAEFNYQPTACRQVYRMVVVRKNITKEKGELRLHDEIRYFFYITNDWVSEADEIVFCAQRPLQPGEPHRAVGRGLPGAAGTGGQFAQQLGVHGNDGNGVGPEGVVGAALTGGPGPASGQLQGRQTVGTRPGVQDVRASVRATAMPDRAQRQTVGLSIVVMESAPTDILPARQRAAVLTVGFLKSESGCSDQPWPPSAIAAEREINDVRRQPGAASLPARAARGRFARAQLAPDPPNRAPRSLV